MDIILILIILIVCGICYPLCLWLSINNKILNEEGEHELLSLVEFIKILLECYEIDKLEKNCID